MKPDNSSFRIVFFTQDDPFYVRLFFEEFFKFYEERYAIGGVVICDVMGKRSFRKLLGQMFEFYGTRDFVRMGTRYVAGKTFAASPAWMRSGRCFNLEQLCARYGIPVLRSSGIQSPGFLSRLRGMEPDLLVSVAAPVIFKKDVIDMGKFGCINIHSGKLPRYRGMMPNFWQLYHGESKVGITVHEINEKIDDGRIILQKDVDVLSGETLESLMGRTKRIGAHLMIEAIGMLRDGNVQYRENPAGQGSYFSFPTREDVREFKRRGKRLM
jgi:methionyl-tRNA formyltransferase